MDYIPHFHREVLAFEAAARRVSGEAPLVPSCPDWSVADLVLHLGIVHRYVTRIFRERRQEPLDPADRTTFEFPEDMRGWPMPENAPNHVPLPDDLIEWFTAGAAGLAAHFADSEPGERVWTWSREQTTGFWLRMQAIEAAVHRWDAQNATGATDPVDAELARDAIDQNFEVMAPARRERKQAPAGSGERYRFRESDGPGDWTVRVDGDARVVESTGQWDVEMAGTASDLMLFLWQRIPADRLEVRGDQGVLDRYFTLVPPD